LKATKLRAKQSVSELAGKTITVPLKRPVFLQQEKLLLPTERGNAYHLFMERIHFIKTDTQEQIQQQLLQMTGAGVFTAAEAECINTAQIFAFFQSPAGSRLKKANKTYRELPFTLRVQPEGQEEPVLVQGIIDCCFEEDEKLVLVDYKTDSIKDGVEQIKEKYRAQLVLYKQALERILKKPVGETILYLFENGQILYY
jgi:ATP-dependent helicase/nuclease subunit A